MVEGRRVSGTAGLRSVVAIGKFSGAIDQLRTDCQANVFDHGENVRGDKFG